MGISLAAAARDAGIRLTLLDTLYLHGGFSPDAPAGYAPLLEEQARFSDGSAEEWADRVDGLAATISGPNTAVGAAVALGACGGPDFDRGSRRVGLPTTRRHFHVHVSEQPAENRHCLEALGRTPIAVVAEEGGLGPQHHPGPCHARHGSRHRHGRRGRRDVLSVPDDRA